MSTATKSRPQKSKRARQMDQQRKAIERALASVKPHEYKTRG